jgi:nucleoside-diphosphate-sugar epimerase
MLHLKRLFKLVKTGFYPVMGDGQALMEFCYVGNVVAGLILAARSKQAIGRTYYISDERSYTITEVLNAIAKAEGVKLRIIHLPTPVGNAIGLTVETFGKVFRFWPFIVKETGRPTFSRNTVRWSTGNTWICSTEKAKRELGYEPAVSLQEGVQRTVEWYKSVGAL